MSIHKVIDTWFEPLPLETYAAKVEESSSNVPDKCPVAPVIGSPQLDVRCGPILRLLGTLEDQTNNYRGTILVVTHDAESDYSSPPSIEFVIGPSRNTSTDLTSVLKSDSFPVTKLYQELDYTFWRFQVELNLASYEQKVKYTLNSHADPSFQFFIPAVDQSMNVISHSCNGFSLATDTSSFKGSLWFDVLKKHEEHPYHVMLGGGDQIYADAVKLSSEEFAKWLKHKHLNASNPMTEKLAASFREFYLLHYMKWFGKGFWVGKNGKTLQQLFPVAMQQIPSINIFDDHDIIDGFGSYSDRTMSQDVFKGVGTHAYKYYMLFQHQTSMEEKAYSLERSWILGAKPGPYINEKAHSIYARLGKEIAYVGFDCRTERKHNQVLSKNSYAIIFERLQREVDAANGDIKHLLVLLGVPIAYPRLVWLEALLSSRVLAPLKYLAKKGVLLKGMVNEFDGGIEVLDDLDDHWAAKPHKRERNRLVAELTDFGAKNKVRITILSGDVHLCCIGRLKSKHHHFHKLEENKKFESEPEKDPRLIFNIVSSAICNTPPPDGMAKLLHYRNKLHHFDKFTEENTVPLFTKDTDGSERWNYHFLNKRNWCDLISLKGSTRYQNNPHFQEGSYVLPGPLDNVDAEPLDDTFDKYPVQPDSLIATLHVEKDQTNVASETADYELLIPSLQHSESLTHEGAKFY